MRKKLDTTERAAEEARAERYLKIKVIKEINEMRIPAKPVIRAPV